MTGSVFLGASEYSVREGEPFVAVTFQRTGDTSGAVQVNYATTNGTAIAGQDFPGSNGSAIIAAGTNSITVQIPITNDALAEATETFGLSILSIDSGTLLYPRTTNISILDDENPVSPPVQPELTSPYSVTTTNVVTGLEQPMNIEWIPGDPSTALVVEKTGTIKVVNTTTGVVESVLLDIRDEVNSSSDRGLMDVALHPDFENNPYLYAFYVVDPPDTATATGLAAADGNGNRFAYVVRYEVDASGSTLKIVDNSKTILLGAAGQTLADISGNGALDYTDPAHIAAPSSDFDTATGLYKEDYIKVDSRSHAGGALAFGPDGALYVSVGDGTSYSYADPRSVAVQDVTSLSGKILRIDPMTGDGLADNPFADLGDLSSNQSKVWQLGLRNPYSMTFSDDGRLFMSETGWYSHEEINSGDVGANFGWPYYEGDASGSLIKAPGYQDLASAAAFYAQVASGAISITAAYQSFSHLDAEPGYQISAIVGASDIYTGSKYPAAFLNDYFFADIVDGEIYTVDINDRTQTQFVTNVGAFSPVSFSQGPDGYIYFADLANGRIVRLEISSTVSEKLYYNSAGNQTITGTSANDVFVVGASSAGYEIGPASTGDGFAIWNSVGVDVLFGFETIRFSDMTINLSSLKGPVYQDDPRLVQHLVGKTASDKFVISGPSSAYAWAPTQDGTGIVVWSLTNPDDTYDVLDGFESIQFSDITVDLKAMGVTITGTKKSDKIDATHAPEGQPNPTEGNDTIIGGGKHDKIKGLGGNDHIIGGWGRDKANGGDGNDLLSGGRGTNKLIGGNGADSFIFDSKITKSFHKIMDFDSAEGDNILLAMSVFDHKKLSDGDLSAKDFSKLFDYKDNGVLKYDGDKIAKFKGAPDLDVDDFMLI